MNGAIVRAYSLSKDGNTAPYMSSGKRCKNFKVSEFACHDGSDPVFISPELVDVEQDVRDHYEKPVNIRKHSGFRTASHNSKTKNASKQSQHLYGMAADFHVDGVSPQEVYDYLDKKYPNKYGIGLYITSGFVHIDVRKEKSRWVG